MSTFTSLGIVTSFQKMKLCTIVFLVCNHVTRPPCLWPIQRFFFSKTLHENTVQRREMLFFQTTDMNLSKGVFERRVLTRSGLFACLGNGFGQIYWKIVSIRVRTLSNTHFISVKTYQKERFLTSGLTFVAEKRLFLNSC